MIIPIDSILNIGNKVIDRVWPDPSEREKAKLALMQLQQDGELAKLMSATDIAKLQLEINKTEASSSNLFVAGWRPFIGWVCGIAFAYHFILQPILLLLLSLIGISTELPVFDIATLSSVLMGMLGLGGLRTFEKLKGVNR